MIKMNQKRHQELKNIWCIFALFASLIVAEQTFHGDIPQSAHSGCVTVQYAVSSEECWLEWIALLILKPGFLKNWSGVQPFDLDYSTNCVLVIVKMLMTRQLNI